MGQEKKKEDLLSSRIELIQQFNDSYNKHTNGIDGFISEASNSKNQHNFRTNKKVTHKNSRKQSWEVNNFTNTSI